MCGLDHDEEVVLMSLWKLSLVGVMVCLYGCGNQSICEVACDSELGCMIQAGAVDDASSVDCPAECEREDVEAMQEAFQCMDEAYAAMSVAIVQECNASSLE